MSVDSLGPVEQTETQIRFILLENTGLKTQWEISVFSWEI
jgi:hypothetical protein